MLQPFICPDLCLLCQPCQARSACKTRAIVRIDEDEPPYIAIERCTRCGNCVLECAGGAIMMMQNVATAESRCKGPRVQATIKEHQ